MELALIFVMLHRRYIRKREKKREKKRAADSLMNETWNIMCNPICKDELIIKQGEMRWIKEK